MKSDYWRCDTTWKRRYDHFGVTGYALLCAKYRKNLVIIDVGCSKGIAMLDCQECLELYGVHAYTIGIDISEKHKVEARNNLDEFILDNALNVNMHIDDADIVICMNMERYIDLEKKSRIITKCAQFLKPDGMLITSIDAKYRKRLNLEYPNKSIPKLVVSGKNIRERIYNWHKRSTALKDTRMISSKEASRYGRILLDEWQNTNKITRTIQQIGYRVRCKLSHTTD